jgi:acyl carrier protein phosphodiesterase
MNYLAHAYLSFEDPDILVGNMTSDFIKGKKKYDYPPSVLFGIDLHRSIDDFTDNHKVTRIAKKVFQPHYGLYAGAFMDIAYDYFLANDSSRFPEKKLEQFSQQVYHVLGSKNELFPQRFQSLFPYMKRYDWLSNYRHHSGIQRSFEGLVHRAIYMDNSTRAFELFLAHEADLAEAYSIFFPELETYTLELFRKRPM